MNYGYPRCDKVLQPKGLPFVVLSQTAGHVYVQVPFATRPAFGRDRKESTMLVKPLDTTEFADLEKFTPIPFGGIKMLFGALNAIIIGLVALFAPLFLSKIFLSEEGVTELAPLTNILGLILMFISFLYFTMGKRGEWICSYFDRNVRGYIVRFWMFNNGDEQQLKYTIVNRNVPTVSNDIARNSKIGFCLDISLGGWFKHNKIQSTGTSDSCIRLRWIKCWHFKLRTINWNNGRIFIDVNYYDSFGDERVILEVNDVIRLVYLALQPEFVIFNISGVFRTLLDQTDQLETKVGLAKQALVNHNTEFRVFFVSLVKQINETTRLKTTIEGLELEIVVLEKLYSLYDTATKERIACQHALAVARDDLDHARTRMKHRKPRANPSVVSAV